MCSKIDSKKACANCEHHEYCNIANRCDGTCYKCDIFDCDNNPYNEENKTLDKIDNEIKVIIGSYHEDYEECVTPLDMGHITFNDFQSWEEVERELDKQGFDLEDERQTLIIRRIKNFVSNDDYIWQQGYSVENIFETFKKSGILESKEKYRKAYIFCHNNQFYDWTNLIQEYGANWDNSPEYKGENNE